jgi:asparagine synthase (glutamine-hydrolysing)
VPPGWRATLWGGRFHLGRYWDPSPKERPIQWLTTEVTDRFDTVLDRAVDRCLCNGPTGIFLSGGLDSISVAAVAADRARRNGQKLPVALSLGFPDPECDERLRQAAVARGLGLRQYLIDFNEALGSRPLLEQSLELNRELTAPLLNLWWPAYLALARRGRYDGVQTILTGHGGDEWLTVGALLSADLIRRGAFVELARFFATLWRSYPPSLRLARNVLWKYGLRPLAGLAFHRLMPEVHKAGRLKRVLASDPSWATPDPQLRAEQRRRAESVLTPPDPPAGFYLRDGSTTIDSALASWDHEERYEIGKQLGVRFLHPLSDPDLVELLFRTPPRVLNDGGRSKGLIRQALARRFPALGLDQQRKVTSLSFFQSLLLREASSLAKAAGDFPALSALGLVDRRTMRTAAVEGLREGGRQSNRIWDAINLEMWVQSQRRQQHG